MVELNVNDVGAQFILQFQPNAYYLVKLLGTFLLIAFLYTFVVFIKYAIRRIRYSKQVPCTKLRVFDILGHVSDVPRNPSVYGFTTNVFFLQHICAFAKLFKDCKLFCVWLSYFPMYVLCKAESVETLINGTKNMEKGSNYQWLHPWLGTGLLTSHGSKWKSRRKLLTPSFHFEILKDFLPVFHEQAQTLVNVLENATRVDWIDIIKPVTLCSLDIICETTLGTSINAQKNKDSEYVQAVLRTSEIVVERMLNATYWFDWIFYFTDVGKQFKKDLNTIHSFTISVIKEKKRKIISGESNFGERKRKALMDLLLEHHFENQDLTDEDIREEVDTFAFEGHDTTSMGMCWALYLLGCYKDIQANVHEELDKIFGNDVERPITTCDLKDMEYLDRVLKESQRLYPSVPAISRKINEDVIIDGHKIPKGETCGILIYMLHRDENAFPDPEKFDPDRFLPENTANRHPYAYVPFSAGPRNCIGQRFALMEEKIVVANILRNYTVESLDPRDQVLPSVELVLRPGGPLRIKIRRRK